jgi:hypothetical protein
MSRHYHAYRTVFKSDCYSVRQCKTCEYIKFKIFGSLYAYYLLREKAEKTSTGRKRKNPKYPPEHPFLTAQKVCSHDTITLQIVTMTLTLCRKCGVVLSAYDRGFKLFNPPAP